MCGIAGFQGLEAPGLIERMRDAIRHRGPDGEGIFTDFERRIALAHTRLSIIDLSAAGHQPMLDRSENVIIVFNGEIYNFRELRQDLERRGHVFRSRSDTEVILNLYLQYGEACFGMLNGIFAIAIYDRRDDLLRIARDGMGVKPLYYSELNGSQPGFLFASEIKSILQCAAISRELFIPAIQASVSLLWQPGPWTSLKDVYKVQPGECLVVGQGRVRRRFSFYSLPVAGAEPCMSVADAVSELRVRLQTAVERQMIADVPVGAFLSGGLDSSAIVAMAARSVGHDNVRCFTIDTGGSVDAGTPDDLPYARTAAKALNVRLEVLRADPVAMLDGLPGMLWSLDEPQADLAPLNVLAIARNARQQGYKVLLSGAGGDDLFSGYRRHTALQMESWWQWLPAVVRQYLARLTSHFAGQPHLRRVAKLFAHAGLDENQRMLSYFSWLPDVQSSGLLSDEAREAGMRQGNGRILHPLHNLQQTLTALPAGMAPLDKLLQLESRYFLVDHNFNYTDKMSMAAGVETRVPLLDPDLVSMANRIPVGLKHRGLQGKWIFKKAMEGILPNDIIWRKKSGFGVPLRSWLHRELRPLVEDTLAPSVIRSRGLFNAVAVRSLIDADRNGRVDASYSILSLVCIELWCRQFIDPAFPVPI